MNPTLALMMLVAADPAAAFEPNVAVNGEVRARAEMKREADLNESAESVGTDGEQVFLRTRVTVKGTPAKGLNMVAQLQDSRTFGQEPTTAANLGNVDLHLGYIGVAGPGGIPVIVHVGRMELSYGDQRLLGAFGWSNTGRSFDGVRLRGAPMKGLTVDAFWARLHTDPRGARAPGDNLAGLYAWWNSDMVTVDVYALALLDGGGQAPAADPADPAVDRFPGGGKLQVYTPGVRVDAKPVDGLHVNAEGAFQTGKRGDLDVSAFAAHAGVDYTVGVTAKPKVEAGFDMASGDKDGTDGTWGTFENLFPTNHLYYGYLDMGAWKNIQDIYAGLSAAPAAGLMVLVRAHMLSRVETEDTFYRASGAALRPLAAAQGTDAKAVGTEIDVLLKYKVMDGLGLLAGWSMLQAGDFLKDTGGGSAPNPQFGYLQVVGAF